MALGLVVSAKGDLRRACQLLAEAREAAERTGAVSLALTNDARAEAAEIIAARFNDPLHGPGSTMPHEATRALFDIVSGGELQRVINAGGDPGKCAFAGVGKSEGEIEFALKQGVYTFNAESEAELVAVRDDMYRYPTQLAMQAAFAGHPYGVPLGGTEETLRRIDLDLVREWHRDRALTSAAAIGWRVVVSHARRMPSARRSASSRRFSGEPSLYLPAPMLPPAPLK